MRKPALLPVTLVAAVALAAVLGLTGAVALAGKAKAVGGAEGTLYVVERGLNTAAALDAATGQVVGGPIAVGVRPIGVTAPRGTGKVYSSDETSNRMSVIDKATFTVVKTIPMGLKPHHLMASADGKRIYVGEYGQNTVGVIDTATDTRIASWEASKNTAARTHAVWISAHGRALYATNEVTNDIAKIDTKDGTLLWNLPIGARPSEILVRPDGKTAYVSVRNENRLKVVDLETRTIVASVHIGVEPDTLSLTDDAKTLVVGLRGVPATAALFDTRTHEVRFVDLPGHTTTGHQWLSPNGKLAFMAVESPGAIAVIDVESGTFLREYPYPGGPLPHGVYFEPEALR
jgi:YVTN family beta-propeller protein